MCSEASFATTIEKLHRAEFPCELVFGHYERAAAALSLLPSDKLEVVLQMLEGMALVERQEKRDSDS